MVGDHLGCFITRFTVFAHIPDPADILKPYYDFDDRAWFRHHLPYIQLYFFNEASTVVTLQDWDHQPALVAFEDKQILAPYVQPFPSAYQLSDFSSTPNSTLINGRGRYPGGPKVPLTVLGPVQLQNDIDLD